MPTAAPATTATPRNTLYYGDNLAILRDYIASESVDLVYLDPPFNSNRNYNVLFKNESGSHSRAQIKAFEDTWHWDATAIETYDALRGQAGKVGATIDALHILVGENPMMAYLVMMAVRLVELHRVLKPTGSLYLHCDPTASHYLKILLDAIFGIENFRNEIVWKRTTAKSLQTRKLAGNHDIILAYQKTDAATWNESALYQAYAADNLDAKTASKYTHVDENGRVYTLDNLLNPNKDRPNLTYEFLGVKRVWRWTKDRMQKAYEDGLIHQAKPGNVPRFKRYLDEQRGRPIDDVWTDINPLNSQSKERLGYPTQKPVALLERIVAASSNPGDVVLDPFAGCGTAIAAAQKLGRRWIGIDITHLSIALLKNRLKGNFEQEARRDYAEVGVPEDGDGASALAAEDRYQFQFWAVGLIGAKPYGGDAVSQKRGSTAQGKKGADTGIDGELVFIDADKKRQRAIVQVKSGHVSVTHIRELIHVVEREGAVMGIYLCLEPPTAPMRQAALGAGRWKSAFGIEYPRIQLLTMGDLLSDMARVQMPPTNVSLQRAGHVHIIEDGTQIPLL